VISGFGGQGVLSMGKILAYSGIKEDKEVSWFSRLRAGAARRYRERHGDYFR